MKLLLSIIVLTSLTACAVSPTGRQQFLALSPGQLNNMGDQAFAQIKSEQTVDGNPRTNAYVRCVADAIVSELRERDYWEVVVFRGDAVNAFALPGGKIGVYTGLLKVARNQDQLAAVIGHEVGHVVARHANERVSQEMAVQLGLAGIGAVAGGSGYNISSDTMRILGLGAQVGILLPYSRIHESEADEIGLDLMARAGFDPRQSAQLWRNMASQGDAQPPEFLSTHPAHGTRIRDLEAKMGPAIDTYQAARSRGKRPRCARV